MHEGKFGTCYEWLAAELPVGRAMVGEGAVRRCGRINGEGHLIRLKISQPRAGQ